MRFYDKVNELCTQNGISITALAIELGFSKGTPTNWKTMTKPPRPESVKKVADYFKVPVSYLTDESVTEIQTVNDNHGIIGNTHAPVTIMNGDTQLTQQELELLNIFRNLSIMEQAKLLVYAEELRKSDKP